MDKVTKLKPLDESYSFRWEIIIEADSQKGAMDAVWDMWVAWKNGNEPIGMSCPRSMGNRVMSRVRRVRDPFNPKPKVNDGRIEL